MTVSAPTTQTLRLHLGPAWDWSILVLSRAQ
jgi:hypothetical protein